jgi:hypothetical protein
MADPNRLEREIEEILGRIEQLPPPESRAKRAVRRTLRRAATAIADRQRAVARELSRVSLSQMILLSFLMIIGAVFFRRVSPLLMDWLLVGGAILFIVSFAMLVFGSRGGATRDRQWRGRPIRYQTGPTLQQRVRRWWNTRSNRR